MQKHLPALTPVSGWVSEWLIVSDSRDSFRIYRACKHVQSVFSKLIFAKCTLLVHLISFRSWFLAALAALGQPWLFIHSSMVWLEGVMEWEGEGVQRLSSGQLKKKLCITSSIMNQHHNHHQLEFRGICLALPQSPAAGQRGGWYLHICAWVYPTRCFFSSLVPPIKVQTS